MSKRRHLPIRSGYTLIELVIAMVGASALMVGLSSSIFIALKATSTSDTPTVATIEGNAALTDMLTDIEFALSFSEQTSNAITFTVPDRNGDSTPETIRYAWSGTPGDPITRQYNGGDVATLVDNVHVFQHDLPVGAANLLSNPGMELGTLYWDGFDRSTTLPSFPSHTGLASQYHLRWDNSGENGIRQDITSSISNGVAYQLSFWLHTYSTGGPYDAKAQLRVTSSGGGEQVFAITPTSITSTATWYLVDGAATPIWTGTLESAYFEAVSDLQECRYDDATFRVLQTTHQQVNFRLQVGPDPHAMLHCGGQLINSPL